MDCLSTGGAQAVVYCRSGYRTPPRLISLTISISRGLEIMRCQHILIGNSSGWPERMCWRSLRNSLSSDISSSRPRAAWFESVGDNRAWRHFVMSSLRADFDELRERIRQGRELGHASFEPIFY